MISTKLERINGDDFKPSKVEWNLIHLNPFYFDLDKHGFVPDVPVKSNLLMLCV